MNKFLSLIFPLAIASVATAQQKVLTTKDYARAEQFLTYNTEPLVDRANIRPNWLPNGQFWYRVLTPQGSEFMLIDPARKTRQAAFDQQKLATSLSAATGKTYTAFMLPFRTFVFSADQQAIVFVADAKQWKCDLQTYAVVPDNSVMSQATAGNVVGRQLRGLSNQVISPDGKKAAFIKDDNLWVRDLTTKQETQLTTDGIKNFGYATDNAGWTSSDAPILLWSPDSKKIATNKQDERNVSDMYLVSTNVGKPTLRAWKYPLPGDKEIAMIQRVIIQVDQPKTIVLQIPPDAHRSSFQDDISMEDLNWSPDGSQLAFISTSRDHKQEKVRIADAATGTVHEVFQETVPTQYESGWGSANWKFMPRSNEILWFSERDNWGHLYLYDASTGKLKNQITKGDWVVTKIIKIDEKNRQIYFMADGREPENLYFSQLCKIGFDGKHFELLTPESGNHTVSLSPDGQYFIDSYSKPNVPPVMVLRDLNGKLILSLEKTDVSRLAATGWHAPTPITIKAHDGKTDLYGLLFTPTNLDAQKKYPVIDYIYPGPQGGSVGSWSFAASRGDHQALAELGFVVVLIEGTSNPLRSKSFHDMSYGNMSENTLPIRSPASGNSPKNIFILIPIGLVFGAIPAAVLLRPLLCLSTQIFLKWAFQNPATMITATTKMIGANATTAWPKTPIMPHMPTNCTPKT